MSNLSEKRNKIQPRKQGSNSSLVILLILVAIGAGAALASRPGGTKQAAAATPSGGAPGSSPAKSAKSANSANSVNLQMTDIQATVENGKISVPVDVVKEKGLVRFTYKGAKAETPLLAYVMPSGNITTAVSMCEPCSSTRFFIQGNRITCSACYTQWDLESLKGISGGCTKYPPDKLANTISNGNVLIDEATVAKWTPRV